MVSVVSHAQHLAAVVLNGYIRERSVFFDISLGGAFILLFELEFFDTGGEPFRRFAILLPRLESGKLFLLSSIPLS